MANPRAERVAKRIQQIVAQTINTRMKDPRLNMVTITDTRVTGDLQHATVFFTAIGHEHQVKDAARGLEAAKGALRSEVGRQLGLRLTPTLEFVADELPEGARTFEDVLAAALHRDAELARNAEGKEYAGEADPYRKPREVTEDDGAAAPSGTAAPSGPVAPSVPEAPLAPEASHETDAPESLA
ncbi:30S ribosome-binding factor RbfA [Actinotignum schaalii]|uniref:30S ribosome-binding factor RbfA n=1 Tax=Actinotignum schaalii TaxID=59505 RepID=UPI0003F89E3B|nr:30S ribosome-binding factor RbfA [Actinotignum schaalii]AIE82037.1 ribosome-binding factor A [Actinotignum schaalii]WQN45713.1 30S ribosome-binding factor RbfA [Actinotignum schaalii]